MATEKEKLVARYQSKIAEVPTHVSGKQSVIAALQNEADYGTNDYMIGQVEELNREIDKLNDLVPEYQEVLDLLTV
ncbi:MAG: hypothetical protein R3E32_03930 [Chitinophagales bacterium]